MIFIVLGLHRWGGQGGALAKSQVLGRLLAAVRYDFVTHLGALVEPAQASFLDSRDVHEDILAAAVRLNKSKSLSRVVKWTPEIGPNVKV